MKLKTFSARDLKDALSQVKKEMGPEAVILSTQSRWVKEPQAGKGRRPGVEVTAAVDLTAFSGNGEPGNGNGDSEIRGDLFPPFRTPVSPEPYDTATHARKVVSA